MEISKASKIKVLFLSTYNDKVNFGGAVCSVRNLESIRAVLPNDHVIEYYLMPKQKKSIRGLLVKMKEVLLGYMLSYDNQEWLKVKGIIEKENITHIFVDTSLLGFFIKQVKQVFPSIQVISFFHNFELTFLFHSVLINKQFSRFYWIVLAYFNEKKTVSHSDIIVVLNDKDKLGIQKVYKRSAEYVIPISIKDNYRNSDLLNSNNIKNKEKLKILFVGSYFYANIQGINWFVKRVLRNCNAHLIIVGKDMSRLKFSEELSLEIHSDVESLESFYLDADLVVAPIFYGSGMKVKIAEALMYNKPVVGTNLAFEGYVKESHSLMRANSAIEFIQLINDFERGLFHNQPRELYIQNYSFDSTLSIFKHLFKSK